MGSLTLVMALYGAGYGTLFPSACAIVVDRTVASNRGTAFGLFYAAFSFGVTIGPVAAGVATSAGFNPYWLPVAVIVAVRLALVRTPSCAGGST
jgi:MFS transporter, DHA1 family, multidrug resistance protein